jgi:hypothetical protein
MLRELGFWLCFSSFGRCGIDGSLRHRVQVVHKLWWTNIVDLWEAPYSVGTKVPVLENLMTDAELFYVLIPISRGIRENRVLSRQ